MQVFFQQHFPYHANRIWSIELFVCIKLLCLCRAFFLQDTLATPFYPSLTSLFERLEATKEPLLVCTTSLCLWGKVPIVWVDIYHWVWSTGKVKPSYFQNGRTYLWKLMLEDFLKFTCLSLIGIWSQQVSKKYLYAKIFNGYHKIYYVFGSDFATTCSLWIYLYLQFLKVV